MGRAAFAAVLDEVPIVEELLTGDEVVLDRVEPDFIVLDALAAGLGGELDRGVDGEPAGARVGVATEERPAEVLAVEGVVACRRLPRKLSPAHRSCA